MTITCKHHLKFVQHLGCTVDALKSLQTETMKWYFLVKEGQKALRFHQKYITFV